MKSITPDMLDDFKFIQNLKESPSRKAFAYTVAQANRKKNNYQHTLYVNDGKNRKVLHLKEGGAFVFETERTLLASFSRTKKDEAAKKDKKTPVYRINLDLNTVELAYEFLLPATILEVLDENTLLLSASLSTDEHALYTTNDENRQALLTSFEDNQDVMDIDTIPFYGNGTGFTGGKTKQLFLYDVITKHMTPLFEPSFSFNLTKVSADHKKIYATGSEDQGIKGQTTGLYVYDLETGKTTALYDILDHAIKAIILFDDKVVVAATDMADFGMNQNSDFFEVRNNKLMSFQTFSRSFGSSVGTDVRLGSGPFETMIGEVWYFVETTGGSTVINSLDQQGTITQVFHGNGSIDGMIAFGDQLVVTGLFGQELQEIYVIDMKSATMNPVSKFNAMLFKDTYVAKPQAISVSFPTHQVDGWVLFPRDYDENQKYPAILDIHGGPKTVYGPVFYHEMQIWAGQGYFVMFCNPRGSDGKGNEFADLRGKYGTIDYDDIMAFVNEVTKSILAIDTGLLYVTGGSYGGYMTNWIVGQTDMFKAAVTQRSISNWLSFYGTSDIGYGFAKDQTGGHPVSNTTDLWRQSPLAYAQNVKTPLLFIHADADYRCPIEQAMQFYTILKEQGLDTRLLWFKNETHELSRSGKPQARKKRLAAIAAWFHTHP